MNRSGVGALMLYLSAQAAASFAPEAAANEIRTARPEAVAQSVQRLVVSDPTWDAFVFVSAATAVALEMAIAPVAEQTTVDTSWAFLAPEPQFDYLAALSDVGIASHQDQPQQGEPGWLS